MINNEINRIRRTYKQNIHNYFYAPYKITCTLNLWKECVLILFLSVGEKKNVYYYQEDRSNKNKRNKKKEGT